MGELKKMFRPEFLNRVDDIIVFRPLTKEELRGIVVILTDVLRERLLQNKIHIGFSDAALDELAKAGYDPIFGARPLRRSIQNVIEDKLAEEMLNGRVSEGDSVYVDCVGGEITLARIDGGAPQDPGSDGNNSGEGNNGGNSGKGSNGSNGNNGAPAPKKTSRTRKKQP